MAQISKEQMRELLKVYFIMGSSNCNKHPLDVMKEAIEGGITLFQYREKGKGALSGDEYYELGKQIQALCKQHNIPFIVNDDVKLALALDADGIHIGQEDEAVEIVRKKIGDKILGVSAHTIEEARVAVEKGADYLGIGPIFPTASKEDAKAAQGTIMIESLRKIEMDIPVVGIGGINAVNAASVVEAGADGVSLISFISLSSSPYESTKQIVEAVGKGLRK
ncbi:thiamine phosphate synthase [Bacillus sp. 165]|uniref:thiamine phosphate synthase n=1 Tax=Bacillus sp. 165 TaxID=1529117 RepID=UPI001ADCC501|nr:thiamine phosphate synthase [Bacillus sp. 165]MBO9130156.1 thiamine phosphate synthase [Bacillus sp. 165]